MPDEEPWEIRAAKSDDRERILFCREEQVRVARTEFGKSAKLAGTFYYERHEKVMAVKLHDKCDCPQEVWTDKACGHPFCAICNSFVHPVTRVTVKSADATVTCNRKPLPEYEFVFREAVLGQKI